MAPAHPPLPGAEGTSSAVSSAASARVGSMGTQEGPQAHWGRPSSAPPSSVSMPATGDGALDLAGAAGWGAQTPHGTSGDAPSMRTQPGGRRPSPRRMKGGPWAQEAGRPLRVAAPQGPWGTSRALTGGDGGRVSCEMPLPAPGLTPAPSAQNPVPHRVPCARPPFPPTTSRKPATAPPPLQWLPRVPTAPPSAEQGWAVRHGARPAGPEDNGPSWGEGGRPPDVCDS